MRGSLLLIAMLPVAAHATGVVRPDLQIVGPDCMAVAVVDDDALRVLHADVAQVCAPPRRAGENSCSPQTYSARPADGLQVRVKDCAAALAGAWVKDDATCHGVPLLRFTGALPRGQTIQVFGPGGAPQVRISGKPNKYQCPTPEPLGEPIVQVNQRLAMKIWVPPARVVQRSDQLEVKGEALVAFLGGEPALAPLGGRSLAEVVAKIPRHPKTGNLVLIGDETRTYTWRSYRAGVREYCAAKERVVLALDLGGAKLTARGAVVRDAISEGRCPAQ